MFAIIAEDYLNKTDWNKINFYWVDERCVLPESSESNYGEAERLLFIKTNSQKNIHRIVGEVNPVEEAERYSEILRTNLPLNNNFPVFDIIILGMGDDGHTASIFSDRLDLLDSDKYCEVAVHPVTKQNRITLTGKLINNSEQIIFLVTGKNKAEIIRDIFETNARSQDFPTSYIKGENGNITWYLDKDAASLI